MTHGIPYQKFDNIYSIAAGLKGDNGILLSPNRAIFSALCTVLSLEDISTQKRILKDEPFRFFLDVIEEFGENNLEYFIDVFTEAKGNVSKNGLYFQDWSKDSQLEYMNRELNPSYDRKNCIRLASAKTRREYFPTTVFFENRHYKKDINSGILLMFLEEMNRMV